MSKRLSPGRGKPWPWHQQAPQSLTQAELRAKVERRTKSKARQKRADDSEGVARQRLSLLGFVQVEKIETARDRSGNYIRAAAADITGLDPRDGRGLLCEVKSHLVDALPFSALEDHQWKNLDAYVAAKAHATLWWFGPHGLAMLCWRKLRACGFGPGTSVTPLWRSTLCLWDEAPAYTLRPHTMPATKPTPPPAAKP